MVQGEHILHKYFLFNLDVVLRLQSHTICLLFFFSAFFNSCRKLMMSDKNLPDFPTAFCPHTAIFASTK